MLESRLNIMKTTTTRSLGLLAMLLCLPAASQASVAPDAQPKNYPANPARHVASVTRTAKDTGEKKLIAAAEAQLPDHAGVLKAADPEQKPAGERLWWYGTTFGEIRVPYAITGEAVDYYAELIGKFGKQEFKGYAEPQSSLRYTASVASHPTLELDGKTFTNVRVVSMTLRFSATNCTGQSMGFDFTKERKVVFDAEGKILHVSGDGPVQVSAVAM